MFDMTSSELVVPYLVAGVLFILSLGGLASQETARRGNWLGIIGMVIAIGATLLHQDVGITSTLIGSMVLGCVIGAFMAMRVVMTGMPQLVAILHSFVGLAAVLVGVASHVNPLEPLEPHSAQAAIHHVEVWLGVAIGAITFTGSVIAWAKLRGSMSGTPLLLPGRHALNAVVTSAIFGGMLVYMDVIPLGIDPLHLLVAQSVLSGLLGIHLVVAIGGADMPVVIALLNSYSGLAAAATGFVVDNNVLIIAGSLVGASGVILTQIMCKAMNRSLFHVLFGVLEAAGEAADADEVYAGKIKSTSADEVAMLYDSVERAIIVPGYGMAVAQAQHAVRELASELESRGVEVEFAIHPVAGRMPGHMNVLLAEAEVPYEKLKEMDEINPSFAQTDVVLVIGANDVVNPDARNDPTSPIAGMPILNVDQARTVVVVKRSLSPGFAGIPNPLFAADNCLMFFGDGKQAILDLNRALKES